MLGTQPRASAFETIAVHFVVCANFGCGGRENRVCSGRMRYANRRRLVVVVVLAALFGAALPYAIWLYDWEVGQAGEGLVQTDSNPSEFTHRGIGGYQLRRLGCEYVSLRWWGGFETGEDWNWMMSKCDNLIPKSARDTHKHTIYESLVVVQYGWPFRAAHFCRISNSTTGALVDTSTALSRGMIGWDWLDEITPDYVPLGVRWLGMFGNVGLSVLSFAAIYCGLANLRARHRIKRGNCWKCGYLSLGAAVCPECGTAR